MTRKKVERKAATYQTARPQKGGAPKNPLVDIVRGALPAGWRKSASGKWYYEVRKNRSDTAGEVKILVARKEAKNSTDKKPKRAAATAPAKKTPTKKIPAKKAQPRKAANKKTRQVTLW